MQEFWNTYAAATRTRDAVFGTFVFGDSTDLADELVALVLARTKRATAHLYRDFMVLSRPVPKPGDFGIILDGHDTPRCIIRTVQVEIKPIRDVDERFAWDEGEGDRSLTWWVSAHTRYFKRQGAREGFVVDGDTEVVLQRFVVVWPPEFSDGNP